MFNPNNRKNKRKGKQIRIEAGEDETIATHQRGLFPSNSILISQSQRKTRPKNLLLRSELKVLLLQNTGNYHRHELRSVIRAGSSTATEHTGNYHPHDNLLML